MADICLLVRFYGLLLQAVLPPVVVLWRLSWSDSSLKPLAAMHRRQATDGLRIANMLWVMLYGFGSPPVAA